MISFSSLALQLFAATFGIYHAVLGVLNMSSYQNPSLVWLAVAFYLFALLASVFFSNVIELPSWIASINLVVAVLLPLFVTAGLGEFPVTPYTTWHVAAIGTLLAITAVRGQKVVAWIGIGFLILEVIAWGGTAVLFNSGLIGAVLLVLAAQAASRALDQSDQLASKFREQAMATEAATAAKSAARIERERRVNATLAGVLPQLRNIVEKTGRLNEKERRMALLTEAELRDQIRGRHLVHDELTEQARLARTRGVEVQLLDDGGLDELEPDELDQLLDRVARELSKIQTGRVVIRSVAGEDWRLTMAAIRKGADQPDLFLRL
ncbi:MAG: hypothetical protein NWQ88_00325 [Aquiluna sp.]|nr:hypothetical protein [Aquiluna sp.]MDP4886458.1 hypothetical protein [Aquiluna sp.]